MDVAEKSLWARRMVLKLPTSVMKNLKKGKKAYILRQGQYIEFVPNGHKVVVLGSKRFKVSEEMARKVEEMVKGK